MADDGSARTRQQGLQQAASVIFALVAVVPLLIFAWTLHTLGVIRSTQAQLSLGLALAVALLGFWMFRSMLGRMAEVVQALAAAVEQANRTRRPPTGAAPAATPPTATAAAARPAQTVELVAAGASEAPAANGAPPAAPRPPATPAVTGPARVVTAAPQARTVPGIGKIRELNEVMRTMDALWHREASAHVGRRVQISVANSREPLIGTLSEASEDGLILDQGDSAIAVAYGRVTSIDRLTGSD